MGRPKSVVVMANKKKVKLPSKVCEYASCGKTYEQGDAEAPSRFRERKYCGPQCRQAAQRTDPNLVRKCDACGGGFKCRDGEEPWRFKQRRSCSSDCAVALRKGKRYGDPTYQSSRDPSRGARKSKSSGPTIRIVEATPQLTEPVRWVPTPEPKLNYVPTTIGARAENLTQAERTARRARFSQTFRAAS
jgi:hypothetical protein